MDSLRKLDLEVEMLNLQDYFGKREELKEKLQELGAIFISGGNVFVLRQAIKLSGLDEVLNELLDTDFLYAGYSAAGCVLAPNLKAYEIVDKVDTPYPEQKEVIWEGLISLLYHIGSRIILNRQILKKRLPIAKKIIFDIKQLGTVKC